MLAFVLSCAPTFALDLYNITKETHVVPLSGDIGSNVKLGLGLNLDDPDSPVPAPLGPFAEPTMPNAAKVQQGLKRDEIFSSTTAFIEDQTDYELTHVLRANMKATFAFGSGNVAFDYVKRVTASSDVIVAIISQSITSAPIDSHSIVWKGAPSSEQISSRDERLLQFVADYGSHYVQAIRYGYKVAIYGRKQKGTEAESRQFKAAFKAAFGSVSGAGNVAESVKTELRAANVELRAEVTSGGLEPRGATTFTSFDQIAQFLDGIRTGNVTLYSGPIEVTAKSYWHTLQGYPKTRAVLEANIGRVEAPFGVPKGTVVAWNPPPEALHKIGDVKADLMLPEGWALCDGTRGTPNLTDKFILGSAPLQVGETGGSDTHTHTTTARIDSFEEGGLHVSGGSQGGYWQIKAHADTSATTVLPPYYRLVYIMRL